MERADEGAGQEHHLHSLGLTAAGGSPKSWCTHLAAHPSRCAAKPPVAGRCRRAGAVSRLRLAQLTWHLRSGQHRWCHQQRRSGAAGHARKLRVRC